MVKSTEQQINFLNQDLLPLYGIKSTQDTNTVVNTENLDNQLGFLDKVNKILPFVTLFYPIKKFNLHKTNHMVQTIRQAFSLLVHCLEISGVQYTIWTKKHKRKNIQFLRLNTENCIHRPLSIVHIIQNNKSMTQSQTFNQQLYDMTKIASLDDDGHSGDAVQFIGQPQVTLFKQVYRRPTHYRKFPVELRRINGIFTIDHNEYVDINTINGLIIVFKVDNYDSFEQAFSLINLVTVKIGETIIFQMDGPSILSILKLYPTMYTKSVETYKSGQLIVPIQYFLTLNYPLNLCYFDENMTIDCISKYDVKCFCHGFKLTETECQQFKMGEDATLIWQYLTVTKNNCDEITLDYPICMSELIVKTNDNEEHQIQLDGINLLNNKHPLIEYNKQIITEDNVYYYLSQLGLDDNDHNLCGPFGGFILGKPSTKLTIAPQCTQLCLLIRFKSQLININHKARLGHRFAKTKPNYDNFYPLTKKTDNHYIEGYWYADLLYDESLGKLPFPKQTDVSVDGKFLDKLIAVTNSKICQTKAYFGFSTCRLCDKLNGSVEYTVTHGGLAFTFPEGLMHYYMEHHVQPSTEFYNFIMSLPQTSSS